MNSAARETGPFSFSALLPIDNGMGLLGATVLLGLVVTAVVFGLALLRRRYAGGSLQAVAESQRRFLAANWDAVERAAARTGMGPDEIAEVRRNVFGD